MNSQGTEFESADSVTSTPRSEHHYNITSTPQRRLRFMCSFGGKILPRPLDNQLRYVGGDTRIVAVNRHSDFKSLLSKLVKLSGTIDINVKYQLPNEEFDSLITVSSDEDVENMMEEYDRLIQNEKSARLRLFLFPNDAACSRATSIGSFLDGSAKREQWFLDSLNAGSGLERGRSEVSLGISEMPDYLFGLDPSDDLDQEIKMKIKKDVVDESCPDSPGPSYVNVMLDLPPIKTKPANSEPSIPVMEENVKNTDAMIFKQTGFVGNNITWNYTDPMVQPIPVYFVPNTMQASQFVQPYNMVSGQVPVGFSKPMPTGIRQVYGGGVIPNRVGNNSPMYYGVRSAGLAKTYMVLNGEESQRPEPESKRGWVSQAP